MASKPTDPTEVEALQRQIAELQARLSAAQQTTVSGSGAVAQGGSDALAERSVKVGDNAGTIVTGTQIVTNYYAAAGGQVSKERIAHQVAGYLAWLCASTKSIVLRGIERADRAPVMLLPLETAYVPLRAKSMWGGTDIALNQVLTLDNRLVIVGGPGSGKTTVLLHITWALASSLLGGQPEPARSRLGPLNKLIKATRPGEPYQLRGPCAPNELPLPIFVPLASFARYRRNLAGAGNAPAREWTLAYFISHHLISKHFDLPTNFFVQLLKDGQDVLLLLDGLDEVANEGERAEVRQSVEELVAGRETMRVVVTCRTIAYRSGRTALSANFREIAVQPLDFQQHIVPMVRQAYACIYPGDAALRAERTDDLLGGIQRLEGERRARLGERTEALVDSPLMVRLLLIVHMNNRTLPDERADLFNKAINALLQVDYGREEGDMRELSTDWTLYRDMAQHLALHMHRQGRDQGREIEEPALKKILTKEIEFRPRIEAFLTHARQRGSVLEERGGAYRFIHLAFQEFLVGRYLSEVIGRESRAAILAFLDEWLDDPWWREPILLLAGYMAVKAAKAARDFLRALAGAGSRPNARFAAAELAGTAALEWRDSGEAVRADCARRIAESLYDANAVVVAPMRARAGDMLARLGNPRFDPQRFYLPGDDMLGFIRIPADPGFRIGTRKADAQRVASIIGAEVPENEINDTVTPTAEFYIARYPVTVAQFRAFVEATGFRVSDTRALSDPDNRPVRWISWHEALAYCDWLSHQLADSPVLARGAMARLVRKQGWRLALPSELEWEKAARGGLPAALYPWGDTPDPNRANYADAKIGATSAMRCFPPNGFGLHDMIGNVWEWTCSLWGTDLRKPDFAYPYNPDDPKREALDTGDEVFRVVRGGSWSSHRRRARCAVRSWNPPDIRGSSLGFRVVLRSAPVS